MMETSPAAEHGPVLVSDFDGTMTRHDFYKLAIENLIPADTPDFWSEYRAGTITHFEALRRYFAAIRGSEDEINAVVRQMQLDPKLRTAIETLNEAGWRVVVASAGCEWYIRRLLASAEIDIVVHANPGRLEPSRGLLMEKPIDSPFLSAPLGVDKTAVVQNALDRGVTVAFAGDGFPDADAARLVSGNLRFARGDLADVLEQEQLPFHRFQNWSEIPRVLLRKES